LNVIFNFRDTASMPSQPPSAAHSDADDCRCLCGSLLARVVDGYVELKCRRCKRTLQVPITETTRSAAAADEFPARQSV
jgi:phage FluMu protein Com